MTDAALRLEALKKLLEEARTATWMTEEARLRRIARLKRCIKALGGTLPKNSR